MNATILSHDEKQAGTFACVYSADEAAQKLGVSPGTIRRTARKLGVQRIAGRTVAGFVRFTAPRIDVVLPYSA